MAHVRDDRVLIIAPGSQLTLAHYGIPESLPVPSIQIPTRVYKNPNGKKNHFLSKGNTENEIYPIKNGKIVNISALCYLINLIIKTVSKNQTDIKSPIGLLILSSSQWGPTDYEQLTRYCFEYLKVGALSFLQGSLASSYAFNQQNCLVIDIGESKTEITPVIDYAPQIYAQVIIDKGGKYITDTLSKNLPSLSWQQCEDLKKSKIYEVLHDASAEEFKRFFGDDIDGNDDLNTPEDDGIIDVAAIVASGKTREFIEEREKAKNKLNGQEQQEPDIPNRERDSNFFIDSNNEKITVGRQRFIGTNDLLESISEAIGLSMSKVDEISKRQECWNNICCMGRSFNIKGLKESLLLLLHSHFYISHINSFSEISSSHNTPGYSTPSYGGRNTRLNTPGGIFTSQPQSTSGYSQSPTSIRLAKPSEHFPDWKGYENEDYFFLGAEIYAKLIFTSNYSSLEGSSMTRQNYNDSGPRGISEYL